MIHVDDVLAAALAPILADLAAEDVPTPRISARPDDAFWPSDDEDGYARTMLYSADGSGQGVNMLRDAPFPEQVASLADQTQEWAVEELWRLSRSAVWPACPDHPGTHPCRAVVSADSVAVWSCPSSGRVVCAVGSWGSQVRP